MKNHKKSKLGLRDTHISDYPFYESCLQNPSWINMAGFSIDEFKTRSDILKYMKISNRYDYKFVVYKVINSEIIGFCHFRPYNSNHHELLYFGGIRFDLIATGIGLKSAIFVIDYMFNNYAHIHKVCCDVIFSNTSSLKTMLRLGFRIGETHTINQQIYYFLQLTKNNFYNHFTMKILDKLYPFRS